MMMEDKSIYCMDNSKIDRANNLSILLFPRYAFSSRKFKKTNLAFVDDKEGVACFSLSNDVLPLMEEVLQEQQIMEDFFQAKVHPN